MQAITTVGLDIAKSVFQVHGIDAAGKVVVRRQRSAATDWRFPTAAAMPRWDQTNRFFRFARQEFRAFNDVASESSAASDAAEEAIE